MNAHIHVAIPALAEFDYLPATIECLQNQLYSNFTIHICVNQPEKWWNDDNNYHKCLNNINTLSYLKNLKLTNLIIYDRSNKGNGLFDKESNIGFVRKYLMDCITKIASENDIILSLDADTTFGNLYLQSISNVFKKSQKIIAHANPYYHRLIGDEVHDRKILRYEIYMRYYAINLWRIKSPYAFTAFGSAIALPISVYNKIGGISPKKSGEDFYFLQKLRKFGYISTYNNENVFPSSRLSDRVFFGTGPALIRGPKDQWKSYPIYPFELFDEILNTYKSLPELYTADISTCFLDFIIKQDKNVDLLNNLRRNSPSEDIFVKACQHKLDGLAILQFLHNAHWKKPTDNNTNMLLFLENYYQDVLKKISLTKNFGLDTSPIETLDNLRNQLVEIEFDFQKNNFENNINNTLEKK